LLIVRRLTGYIDGEANVSSNGGHRHSNSCQVRCQAK